MGTKSSLSRGKENTWKDNAQQQFSKPASGNLEKKPIMKKSKLPHLAQRFCENEFLATALSSQFNIEDNTDNDLIEMSNMIDTSQDDEGHNLLDEEITANVVTSDKAETETQGSVVNKLKQTITEQGEVNKTKHQGTKQIEIHRKDKLSCITGRDGDG